jgi:hypothetical protein
MVPVRIISRCLIYASLLWTLPAPLYSYPMPIPLILSAHLPYWPAFSSSRRFHLSASGPGCMLVSFSGMPFSPSTSSFFTRPTQPLVQMSLYSNVLCLALDRLSIFLYVTLLLSSEALFTIIITQLCSINASNVCFPCRTVSL